MLRPIEQEFTWQSSAPHVVRRSGFTVARAPYLTSTLSQGQTLRRGVIIDCGRSEDTGRTGMSNDQRRLRLYGMFPRAT